MSKNIFFRLKQLLAFIIPTLFGAFIGYSQRVIWYTLGFTIVGVLAYLALLLFYPWYKEIRRKMKHDEEKKEFLNILKSAAIQVDKLPIHLLLEEYISDKDFWLEKLAIGHFIMKINEEVGSIILDTGTTSAALAIMLMSDKAWPDKIMTNSVTIANFISASKALKNRPFPTIYMPPGILHSEYRGGYLVQKEINNMTDEMYSQLKEALSDLRSSIIGNKNVCSFVAATYFSADRGPGTNSDWNREWKKDTIEIADKIYIGIDISKISNNLRGNGIYLPDEWHNILKSKDVKIILTGSPLENSQQIVEDELKKLRKIETAFNKSILYRGTRSGGKWEFSCRENTYKLTW